MKFDKIIRPINTEKSIALMSNGVYTFVVDKSVDKTSFKSIIESVFNVKVDSVNVLNHKGKSRTFKGISGKTVSEKRMLVKIKEGKIDFSGVA